MQSSYTEPARSNLKLPRGLLHSPPASSFPEAELTVCTVTLDLSPPCESSGNESAEQQLVSESQEAVSSPQQPPGHSAIRSANLLNAVRIDRRQTISYPAPSSPPSQSSRTLGITSSPANMVRQKGRAGQLKRPSFLREDLARNPRTNLARRGDPFLPPESPEKASDTSPFKLPERVNRAPLKRVRRVEQAMVEDEHPESILTRPLPDKYPRKPFHATKKALPSGPTIGGHDLRNSGEHRRKSGRLAGEEANLSRVDFAKTPGFRAHAKTRSKRKAENEQQTTQGPSKSPRIEGRNGTAMEEAEAAEDATTKKQTRLRRNEPQVVIPVRKPKRALPGKAPSKIPVYELEDDSSLQLGDENDFDIQPQTEDIEIMETRSELVKKRGPPAKATRSTTVPIGGQTRSNAKHTEKALPVRRKPMRSRRAPATSSRVDEAEEVEPTADHSETGEQNESDEVREEANTKGHEADRDSVLGDAENIEESEAEEVSDHQSHDGDANTATDLDRVFEFLDSNARRGSCATKDGADIRQACRAAVELVQQPNLTLEEVSDTTKQLQAMLQEIRHNEDEKHRRTFKADAYGYLFRSLTRYLEVLHSWLEQHYRDLSRSLEAMRVLYPFVHAIVSFKDTIARWNIPLPQRYRNDRLVQDVDSQLIVPLRKVDETYCAILSQLEAGTRKWTHEELTQQRKEREEERRRCDESLTLRYKRWHDLHVWRLKYEPDPFLRPHLEFKEHLFNLLVADLDERDANGIRFERIPLFRERLSPARRVSPVATEGWTDAQMEALIDGLTKYAGESS